MQRGVAAFPDLANNGAHIVFDVLGNFALGGQEGGKTVLEIRLPVIKPQYHCLAPIIMSIGLVSRRPDGAA